MNRLGKSLTTCVLAFAIAALGCTARTPPRVVLPGAAPVELAELLDRYPLAADQPVRAERLAVTAELSYHLVQVRPGAGERPHLHAQHDLVVLLLLGQGTQWINRQPAAVRAGDTLAIPAGASHYFVNTGNTPAAALVIFSPPHDGSDQVSTE
ncbi:MAG: cupin domain-containing protein [Deltaproteobacteria bacterium]|nr:cupin domain-containing protein [Deltaproteobacteria bacterium]